MLSTAIGAEPTSAPATDPLLEEMQRSRGTAKPAAMPRAKHRPNTRGALPKTKSRKLGTRKGRGGTAPRGRTPNQLNWDGWPSPALSQVGQIWAEVTTGSGWSPYCSGTVVSRTLVVTAGHCVTSGSRYVAGLRFVPGQTWNNPNSLDVADVKAPYGVWEANDWFTLDSYRQGTGPDWGLMEIKPRNGKFIGDVVGSWPIRTGIRAAPGYRIWVTGYPGSGFWSKQNGTRGRVGRGQYACDTTWDGVQYQARAGGGVEVWTKCVMNRGASGGPWIVQQASGEYAIGGVSNWCDDPVTYDDAEWGTYCTPTSSSIVSLWFDQRFLDFWNAVQPQLDYR